MDRGDAGRAGLTPKSLVGGSARNAIAVAKFCDEAAAVNDLLGRLPYGPNVAARIEERAAELVARARADSADRPILDTFLSEYGLSNKEGVALMCLAESLLRIPDRATAERLIADKIQFVDWASHTGRSGSLLVNASTWALLLGSKLVDVDDNFGTNPAEWLGQLTTRLTEPVIEQAMRAAMRILGREFVLGSTIERALKASEPGQLYSYDMLGEAAREAGTAQRYLADYLHAIATVGGHSRGDQPKQSVSIKLSALHPRYEASQRDRVLAELVPAAKRLCGAAAENGLDLSIDAEESDRLELSLDVFERLATDPELSKLEGLGFVVQAYGKRALAVLEWLVALARETGRVIPVRLVKGAYWDAEIKHAQVQGYPGFPVYTRKPTTDLSYLVCARFILEHSEQLFGQFATHNAHTVAAVMEMAGSATPLEFQRLHGMGEMLYRAALRSYVGFRPLRTYAPVGRRDDLLAYLVRRLLENGANSSFVNRFLDEQLEPRQLVRDPAAIVREAEPRVHPGIRAPLELFAPERRNSAGMDLTNPDEIAIVRDAIGDSTREEIRATSLVAGSAEEADRVTVTEIRNPATTDERVGEVVELDPAETDKLFGIARAHQRAWDAAGGAHRAGLLESFADNLESTRPRFIALLVREAGKTIPDAVAEVREAVDFCRYYAAEARKRFDGGTALPGPTGERNRLELHGRGVFVCISPWNFPLAIFTGQVAAALAAGNAVIAKPAEETPLVAFAAIRLMHESGIPAEVCQLVLGKGEIGDLLVRHPSVDGVAFTGGTDTARRINAAMAAADRPIAPLIAETGGQNAMIVDSTALLEQVTDDALHSAFTSAGQRCSALRVLYLQEDIADDALDMIRGAMDELCIGDPRRIETDVGPIITPRAASELQAHIDETAATGGLLHAVPLGDECSNGSFVAPTLLAIDAIGDLEREHFGPVLHVLRFAQDEFDDVLERIASTGFGLTFGLHTRIEARIDKAASIVGAGNVYANRNMIGAVVGSQPFGGRGWSGTGPKAGGPNYLTRFATERTVTVNTVATGGNAELLSLDFS